MGGQGAGASPLKHETNLRGRERVLEGLGERKEEELEPGTEQAGWPAGRREHEDAGGRHGTGASPRPQAERPGAGGEG